MIRNYPKLASSGGPVLPPRTILGVNQFLQSPNGRYKLVNQEDLNLSLYDGPNAIWVADKSAPYSSEYYPKVWKKDDVSQVFMDYILEIQDVRRRRIWDSVNSDVPVGDRNAAAQRTFLQLQDDGNLVIIDLFPVWYAQGTPVVNPALAATIIPPGTIINPGDTFTIGQSRLIFQGDGNLVFYGANDRVIWASYTNNKGGAFAAMQGDGQFVIYDAARKPIWWTGTSAHAGAYARLQEDGSFAIVTDRVCWARFGYTPTVKPIRVYYPNHADPIEQGHDPFPTYGHIGYEF